MKTRYIKPKVAVFHVLSENCIAAGSAIVKPQNNQNVVEEEWIQDSDESRTIDW